MDAVGYETGSSRKERRHAGCYASQTIFGNHGSNDEPRIVARSVHCLFGPIKRFRDCYQLLEECGRCLFPLQIQRGIVAGVATPALADRVARGAADLTQRQLLDQLGSHRVVWGVGTLRKVTHAMAEMLSVHRQEAQVQQVLGWLKQAAKSNGPRRPPISVGRDGVMIPIVKQSHYKEACTATVSVLDRSGRRKRFLVQAERRLPGRPSNAKP